MTSSDMRDPTSRGDAERKTAWASLSRLAAARGAAPHGRGADDPSRKIVDPATIAASEGSLERPLEPDEYARAIAEIERASAALRRAEPTLEAWRPEPMSAGEPRKPRSISVWILVGGIWLSTITAFASAIGAIFYLLG